MIEYVSTSFGRAWTNGIAIFCDTGAVPEGSDIRPNMAGLAEKLWESKPPVQTIDVPTVEAKACHHPNGKKRCGDCGGSRRHDCYACGNETDCESCTDGSEQCECVLGAQSAGEHLHFEGVDGFGMNATLLAAAVLALGEVKTMWVEKKKTGPMFCLICERGRAGIMAVRF